VRLSTDFSTQLLKTFSENLSVDEVALSFAARKLLIADKIRAAITRSNSHNRA
jgi:hypothetical protein